MLILDVEPELAKHLAEALQVHRRHLRERGRGVPPEYAALEQSLAVKALSRSQRVTEGQAGSVVADPSEAGDGGLMTAPTLLTFAEAAHRMRCSLATVKRRVTAGELVPNRHGRIVLLRLDDVDALIARNRAGGAAC